MSETKLTIEGLGPWSHSKIKSLQNCPFQFYLKYLKKMKVTGVKSPESLVGSAAHKILELYVMETPLDVAYKEAKEEYHPSMGDELWKQVEALEYHISEFKVRLNGFNRQNPIKKIHVEMKIGVTKDFKPTTFFGNDVFFRGILDLALLLENGDAIFIDHKKGGSAEFGIRNYTQQLNSQKILFHGGVTPIEGATSGIHFIEAGQIKLDDHHTKHDIENSLRHDLLLSIDSAIHRVLDLGYFKHIAGNACKWCEFAGPCKGGELKPLELSTKELCSKP